jgi:hypothetical protein
MTMDLTMTIKAWMLVPAATTALSVVALVYLSRGEEGFLWDALTVCGLLWAAMTVPALMVAWLA